MPQRWRWPVQCSSWQTRLPGRRPEPWRDLPKLSDKSAHAHTHTHTHTHTHIQDTHAHAHTHTHTHALQLPTIIADNAGYDSSQLVSELRALHSQDKNTMGLGEGEKLSLPLSLSLPPSPSLPPSLSPSPSLPSSPSFPLSLSLSPYLSLSIYLSHTYIHTHSQTW